MKYGASKSEWAGLAVRFGCLCPCPATCVLAPSSSGSNCLELSAGFRETGRLPCFCTAAPACLGSLIGCGGCGVLVGPFLSPLSSAGDEVGKRVGPSNLIGCELCSPKGRFRGEARNLGGSPGRTTGGSGGGSSTGGGGPSPPHCGISSIGIGGGRSTRGGGSSPPHCGGAAGGALSSTVSAVAWPSRPARLRPGGRRCSCRSQPPLCWSRERSGPSSSLWEISMRVPMQIIGTNGHAG